MVGELLYQDPYSRVAARIASMCQAYAELPPDAPMSLQMTQDDLAARCNLSRKTLYRVLNSLRQQGVLEPGYGSIKVINMPKLCELATGQGTIGVGRFDASDED
jgi:CRP-like cAMP-binding protein